VAAPGRLDWLSPHVPDPCRFRKALTLTALGLALAATPAGAIDPPIRSRWNGWPRSWGTSVPAAALPAGRRGLAGADGRADRPRPGPEDRRQRLAGAFNGGYSAYARLYRICTVSAAEALNRLLAEAEKTARGSIRYAE
jgi:hypothetical protein